MAWQCLLKVSGSQREFFFGALACEFYSRIPPAIPTGILPRIHAGISPESLPGKPLKISEICFNIPVRILSEIPLSIFTGILPAIFPKIP